MSKETRTGDRPAEKPDFLEVCTLYKIYYTDLLRIAEQAGVTGEVLHKMFVRDPVSRTQAEGMLKAFSDLVQACWTMDNVNVPTFSESEDEQS